MTKIRLYFYLGSGVIAALLPLLVATGLVAPDASESVKQLLASIGALIGASGGIVAGTVLNKQTKTGVLEQLDPGAQIAKGAEALQEARNQLEAQVSAGVEALKNLAPPGSHVDDEIEEVLGRIKF